MRWRLEKGFVLALGVLIIVALGITTGAVIFLSIIGYSQTWRYTISDFGTYEADFQTVVNAVNSYAGDFETDLKMTFLVERMVDNTALYFEGNKLKLDESEQSALEHIREAFSDSDAPLESIRVYPGRISFHISNGQYALVYTLDDSKPTFVNTPDETQTVLTKKIQKNWYHVVWKL